MDEYLATYPAVLSVDQVATILAVNSKTVRKLVSSKKLMGIKVGRLIRIPKDKLIDYLSNPQN